MLAKAIATNFNCPFVTIPGSGFAATFIGIDVIVVMFLIRKAKKLARKWGGQCIIFIDEIDAVGMRRASARAAAPAAWTGSQPSASQSFEDYCFFGPWGALTPTGDLILETRAWRERLFAAAGRGAARAAYPALFAKPAQWIQNVMFPGMIGGMGGGGLALNQLLVQMDGIGEAPFMRQFIDQPAQHDPRRHVLRPAPDREASRCACRRPSRPTEQVFFIGATNVPIDRLDPALIRPGRMGRHVWFRTPTLEDRKDIFNLYLAKVDHEPDLDTDRRRDELARITNGYAPAMIEQVCSLALTYSHADGRQVFGWTDIVEAMTTVEAGTARRDRLHPRGDARGRDPRGRPRRQRPPVHEGRALDAAVDPQARRVARAPPGDRDGGAVLVVAQRGVRASSSGRSARWPPSTSSTARTRRASAAT